jgi:hypothetical protein
MIGDCKDAMLEHSIDVKECTAAALNRVIVWCKDGSGVPPLVEDIEGSAAIQYGDVDWETHFQILRVSLTLSLTAARRTVITSHRQLIISKSKTLLMLVAVMRPRKSVVRIQTMLEGLSPSEMTSRIKKQYKSCLKLVGAPTRL